MNDGVLERALIAERAAERELARVPDWLWDRSAPVPIDTLADSHYGLLVREHADLAELAEIEQIEHVSGLLDPLGRVIWVDATEAARAPARRRFTIGHELGHWVLHCDCGASGDQMVHCREETMREEAAVEERDGSSRVAELLDYPPQELDANQFGAALLMPAGLVGERRIELDGDLTALAEAFGVSTMAMEKRLWFLDEARP